MKNVIKFLGVASLIAALIIGCQEEKVAIPLTKLEQKRDAVLSSSQFTNLNIPIDKLDEPSFVNSDENSIAFRVKGSNSKVVVALFNESNEIRGVVYFEVDSPIPSSQMRESMIRKDYKGTFLMKTMYGSEQIVIENSKVIRGTSISGRGLACAGMTEQGGALWCFGTRLDAMNWLESALCYADFFICYVGGVASCAIDGCDPFPSQNESVH
jgi:hypothetical protein